MEDVHVFVHPETGHRFETEYNRIWVTVPHDLEEGDKCVFQEFGLCDDGKWIKLREKPGISKGVI